MSTPKAQRRPTPGSEARKIRVLIVDDHPIVRRGIVAMINQDPGLEVCGEAEGYHEGLDLIRKVNPDLAIIDLTLPDISGLELVKQVKAIAPTMPMLVLSMHEETLYAERVLRAGARGYIMKQEGTEKLIDAIAAVMRGDIYVSEKMASRMLGKLVDGKKGTGTSPLERLSDRELEVFELLGRGLGTREVAERLCVSIKTIESHREHIKEKLQLKNATELVQHATQWVMSQMTDGREEK
ncbi:MAG: response regulator transcription factor [Phycisphaeraceae bacterium]